MKNEQPEPATHESSGKVALIEIVAGVFVIFLWISMHMGYAGTLVMFGIFFLAGAGSAPGGPPSSESVNVLLMGISIGVIVSALAGIPAGVAMMFPRGKRKLIFRWFLGMFAVGLMLQILTVVYFYVIN